MLLAIDVGNTNTVFALFEGETLRESWRCKTDSSRSCDEYAVFLHQLFDIKDISWADINHIIVSSVVPNADLHISRLANKYIGQKPVFVTYENTPVRIQLDQPKELGADRIVNAMGVIEHYQTPAVVIDFGTATTFDVIDSNNIYRGGVIAPGVRLSIEALNNRAAKLPKVSVKAPEKVIGTNTADAMQSGIYWGYISMIEGIVAQIKEELEEDVFVIATGGLAVLYNENTDIIDTIDEHLTLKGLLKIHQTLSEQN